MPDVNIVHNVQRFRQPDNYSCWAACIAMQQATAGKAVNGVQSVVQRASQAGVASQPNGALDMSRANMNCLQAAFGMNIMTNAGTVFINNLEPFLVRAPLILFGAFIYADRITPMNHAIVVSEMWGDRTDSTGITIIDPWVTKEGGDGSMDIVRSWGQLSKTGVARLDYVGALR